MLTTFQLLVPSHFLSIPGMLLLPLVDVSFHKLPHDLSLFSSMFLFKYLPSERSSLTTCLKYYFLLHPLYYSPQSLKAIYIFVSCLCPPTRTFATQDQWPSLLCSLQWPEQGSAWTLAGVQVYVFKVWVYQWMAICWAIILFFYICTNLT